MSTGGSTYVGRNFTLAEPKHKPETEPPLAPYDNPYHPHENPTSRHPPYSENHSKFSRAYTHTTHKDDHDEEEEDEDTPDFTKHSKEYYGIYDDDDDDDDDHAVVANKRRPSSEEFSNSAVLWGFGLTLIVVASLYFYWLSIECVVPENEETNITIQYAIDKSEKMRQQKQLDKVEQIEKPV